MKNRSDRGLGGVLGTIRALWARHSKPAPFSTGIWRAFGPTPQVRRGPAPADGIYGALASRKKKGRRARRLGGVWQTLDDLSDLASYKPKLADHVEVKAFSMRWGNDYAIASNRKDLIFYRLEPGEVELLELMDGTRTVGEMVMERLEKGGDFELAAVADLVHQLEFGNFLERKYVDTYAAIEMAVAPPPTLANRLRRFFRTLTVTWEGSDRLVQWFYRHGVRHLFHKSVQLPLAVLCVGGLAAFLALTVDRDFALLDHSAAREGLVLLLMSYSLTFIHEMAHASVLVHNGRHVKAAGFMIYFGSTAFFIDSSDGLMMERKQRMMMSFSGPYSEMIVAGIASLVAFAFPGLPFASTLYKFAILNYYVVFLNLVPFLELDGYWIFSDLIQVPELRKKSLNFIRHDLWHKLRQKERLSLQQMGLGAYAAAGITFTIFWFYASVYFWRRIFGGIISSLWNGGLVSRAFLIVLAVVILGPALRLLAAVGKSLAKRVKALVGAVRFRLETRWRVEAAELISALPMFDDIEVDVLEDLAGRVKLREYPAGKAVLRQGDLADAFYVVRKGILRVIEEGLADGNERVLRTLGRGEIFGELGLLNASPRAATVRVIEDCQLFEIDKATFDRLLADLIDTEDFAPTMQAAADLRDLEAFKHLEPDQLVELLRYGDWINLPADEIVVKQGEPADAFYAMGSGRAEVVRNRKVVGNLGPGDYFGEIGLLLGVTRTATVRTVTPARLFMLEAKGFERLVKRAFKQGTLNPQTTIERMWEH